jgi:hypothetical protein
MLRVRRHDIRSPNAINEHLNRSARIGFHGNAKRRQGVRQGTPRSWLPYSKLVNRLPSSHRPFLSWKHPARSAPRFLCEHGLMFIMARRSLPGAGTSLARGYLSLRLRRVVLHCGVAGTLLSLHACRDHLRRDYPLP